MTGPPCEACGGHEFTVLGVEPGRTFAVCPVDGTDQDWKWVVPRRTRPRKAGVVNDGAAPR